MWSSKWKIMKYFQSANERLSLLAAEIDDQNMRHEESLAQGIIKLEAKHQEQLRVLKKSYEIELDIKTNLIEEQQRCECNFGFLNHIC